MKILIDTRIAAFKTPGVMTGMGHMLRNIVSHLGSYNEHQFVLVGDLAIGAKNIKNIPLRGIIKKGFNFLWKYIGFPSASLFLGSYDLAFFPNFGMFPINAKKRIAVIADISFEAYPDLLEKKNLSYLKRVIPKTIAASDAVITISQSVRDQIVTRFGYPAEKVYVVYLAPSQDIVAIERCKARSIVQSDHGINREYLLIFGTQEKRKNTLAALDAYAHLPADIRSKTALVLVGQEGNASQEIIEFIEREKLQESVFVLGYIRDSRLVSALFSGARCLLAPSSYEGFGMTLLEAYKCGTEVIANDIQVFREIMAPDALFVDVSNVDAFSGKIMTVINDIDTDKKKQKRMEFAAKFNWKNTTQQIVSIFEKVYEDNN